MGGVGEPGAISETSEGRVYPAPEIVAIGEKPAAEPAVLGASITPPPVSVKSAAVANAGAPPAVLDQGDALSHPGRGDDEIAGAA
jgi:hypothetical protein